MSAWCHGALGIAFSRLRSWSVTHNSRDLNDLNNILSSLESFDSSTLPPRSTFTLCHGIGAIIDLFILSYEMTNNENYLDKAVAISSDLINARTHIGLYYSGYADSNSEDGSMFMGIAGIGYALLRVLAPLQIPSILLPIVKKNSALTEFAIMSGNETITAQFSQTSILNSLFDNLYHRTLSLLKNTMGP